MNRVLVVYYSLTGNTRLIANIIKKYLDVDILELKPINPLNPTGMSKYFWGGMQSTLEFKPKLEKFDINIDQYGLFILGTPVWAWNFTPPMRSFISMVDLSGKKVALWMCSSGFGLRAIDRFKNALKDAIIISTMQFQEPLNKNRVKLEEKIQKWINELKHELSS